MKHSHWLAALAAASVLAAGCGVSGLAPQSAAPKTAGMATLAVPGELVVKFKSARSRQAAAALTRRLGLLEVDSIPQLDVVVFRASGSDRAALNELKRSPEVLFAQPNFIEKLPPLRAERVAPKADVPGDDPMMGEQWALAKMDVKAAWKVTQGDAKTVLAVVDTGVDYKHPDLAGRVLPGYDFANKDADAMDGHSHGTHCAGIAAASAGNGIGIAGVAPKVSILPVKVLSDAGSGTTSDVCKGIVWAVDQGAHVVSLSLGGSGGSDLKQEAVNYAVAKDVLIVAAMGNNGREMKIFPGANQGALAVGATTSEDARASFSNFGEWISVGAPGHQILSTVPGGGYKAFSGTSMATPAVAGLAALVRSQYPKLSHAQVRERIERSADDVGAKGFDKEFGHGRINAAAALR